MNANPVHRDLSEVFGEVAEAIAAVRIARGLEPATHRRFGLVRTALRCVRGGAREQWRRFVQRPGGTWQTLRRPLPAGRNRTLVDQLGSGDLIAEHGPHGLTRVGLVLVGASPAAADPDVVWLPYHPTGNTLILELPDGHFRVPMPA